MICSGAGACGRPQPHLGKLRWGEDTARGGGHTHGVTGDGYRPPSSSRVRCSVGSSQMKRPGGEGGEDTGWMGPPPVSSPHPLSHPPPGCPCPHRWPGHAACPPQRSGRGRRGKPCAPPAARHGRPAAPRHPVGRAWGGMTTPHLRSPVMCVCPPPPWGYPPSPSPVTLTPGSRC